MTVRIRDLAAVTLAGLIVACAPRERAGQVPEEQTAMAPEDTTAAMAAEPLVYEAQFEPGPAGSGVSGAFRVMEPTTPGQPYRVSVTLTGLSPGEHAWHIHSAPCGQEAPVVLALSSTAEMQGVAGPLVANEQGQVARVADVPGLEQGWLNAGQRSLHVHERGGVDHGPTVACATL